MGITTLWVGNALPGTTDQDLLNAFAQFGEIICCFLLKRLSPNGNLSGFVRFRTRAEAAIALGHVEAGSIVVNGSTLTAKWTEKNTVPLGSERSESSSMPPAPPPAQNAQGEEITTIWIGNALPGTVDADMVNAFGQFGNMMCCFLLKRLSPNGQLSGFVRYHNRDDAGRALDAVQRGQIVLKGSIVTGKWASVNSKPLETVQVGVAPTGPSHDQTTGEEITTLWVGNVMPDSTDVEMQIQFAPYGNMQCCFLLKKLSPNGQLSGFVRYNSRTEAMAAMDAVAGGLIILHGATLNAKWASQNSKPLAQPLTVSGPEALQQIQLQHPELILQAQTPSQPATRPVQQPVPEPAFLQQQPMLDYSAYVALAQQPLVNYAEYALQTPAVLPPPPPPPPVPAQAAEELKTIWVTGVAPGTADDDFAEIMRSFGVLVCSFVFKNPGAYGTVNAFAQFSTRQEAVLALESFSSGFSLKGATWQVKWAQENARSG